MKKAEWQAVYAPRGDMLEKRVRQTLMQLEDKPTHARPKRMVWLAAALILVLAAAAAVAADRRVDNRVLFSAGRAAISLGTLGEGVGQVFGIPLSVSGKSPFFDRKKKTQ